MDIGDHIKKLRTQKRLSTYELSKETGISQSVISRLENGKRKADSIIIEKLAEALELSPERLTGKSVSNIIEDRLEDINMPLEEVAEKSGVSLSWLQNIDNYTPGELGGYENGYDLITKVAEVIGLPGGMLRAALARQEIPLSGDLPKKTVKEAFEHDQEDFKEPFEDVRINSFISKDEQSHLRKYRSIDEKGRHTVDTVLDMEYNRCQLTNKGNALPSPQEDKSYLEPLAAHHRTDIDAKDITEEMKQNDMDIMNDPNF